MTSTIKNINDADRPEWSTRAGVFFKHWQSLRVADAAPTSEAFLDTPNPRVQSNTFILELMAENRTVFRLVGTEIVMIWGKDFTELSIEEAFSEELALKYLADPRACLPHQCGLWEKGLFGDTRGREVVLELIYIPLTVKEGRPLRLGGFLNLHGYTGTPASRMGLIELTDRQWINFGFGVPITRPKIFKV